jgi:hypothetical protein
MFGTLAIREYLVARDLGKLSPARHSAKSQRVARSRVSSVWQAPASSRYGEAILLIFVDRGAPFRYRTGNANTRRFYARNGDELRSRSLFDPEVLARGPRRAGRVREGNREPLSARMRLRAVRAYGVRVLAKYLRQESEVAAARLDRGRTIQRAPKRPARMNGALLAGLAQSPLGLRLRDQIRV